MVADFLFVGIEIKYYYIQWHPNPCRGIRRIMLSSLQSSRLIIK
jgi:hypothetical protein